MNIIENLKIQVKQHKKRIVLPETMDERILNAAEIVLNENLVDIILIGNEENIIKNHEKLKEATIIDPNTNSLTDIYIQKLCELRKDKGMTEEEARTLLLNDYMYYACMLVLDKKADGVVSGACHSSSNTLRPALQLIKGTENQKVSAFFLMEVPNCDYVEDGVFIFSDCGLIQNPTKEELAKIAGSSAESFEKLVGKKPYVALLSHSTKGSASHQDVDKVIEATKLAKEIYPQYEIDGELQLDAAIIPEIAKRKSPNSNVAGKANVLIFPNLDSGNIGYKLVERLAKAKAYGPLTQGLNFPINDLSRGCSIEDIVGVIIITAYQAIK